jgi:iron complex outermembrane receptor protein
MKKIIIILISFTAVLKSQTYISKTPITITASRLQSVLVSEAREHTIIDQTEIENMPAMSVADMLKWTGTLDLRSRGNPGVQSDFSLRGSSYDQVLVLVDGIRINDPQTGHHNSDIPVPPGEVERIEILQGPASALYGSDGFGGVISVITKSGRSKDNKIK